jgi:hypothetical protein
MDQKAPRQEEHPPGDRTRMMRQRRGQQWRQNRSDRSFAPRRIRPADGAVPGSQDAAADVSVRPGTRTRGAAARTFPPKWSANRLSESSTDSIAPWMISEELRLKS